MNKINRTLQANKRVALVAHDHCKQDLIDWCKINADKLATHQLFATGTTGHLINQQTGLQTTNLLSGPMGGDQQLGALISEQKIDVLIFFWDPMNAAPHDPDVKALMRIATVWNIPTAINCATADMLIQSITFSQTLNIQIPDYQGYLNKRILP